MKSDHRLGRNFYKGLVGDAVNILLAAAAYNFKRAMKALLHLLKIISEKLAAYNFKRAMKALLHLLKIISEKLSERPSMNDFSLANAF
ncbi:transposase [Porphyromonas gulae]|nr:transposase [Porphyromonas gulae]